VREGQSAPGFTLDLLDDSTLSLSDLQGQVAVLNFWATWCPPCEDELPDFQSVWEEYRQRGVVFVGLAIQEEAPEVEEMLSQFGVTYPVGLDPDQSIALDYGITGVPETFVVDPEGNVGYVHVGPVNGETLRGELEELLAQ
jgi:DsbE subfamily thiol:disulfide oxidoreductase